MYFLISKSIGIFAVPSNATMALALCGLLLWPTRFAKTGRRIVAVSLLLLLVGGASPLGKAVLLPLENRFPPWNPSVGPPTGFVVLGGVISPEISTMRGDITLGGAAERL